MKHVISLGAGVQSSAMALMATHGEIGPMPEAAIFADTQDEPESVYKWLEWLEPKLGFPLYRVTKGKISTESLRIRHRKKDGGVWTKSLIPFFTKNPDGSKGHMKRACTYDYKMMEIVKAQRRILGVKRGQKHVSVTAWIGISYDEITRMKDSKVVWAVNRHPLIDLEITREDCRVWMREQGYPQPPRSACKYCPYHSDDEWIRLMNEEPDEFRQAVDFERELQRTKAMTCNLDGVPFLHDSLVPLDQVVFKPGKNDRQFTNECEGMCGV